MRDERACDEDAGINRTKRGPDDCQQIGTKFVERVAQ
jgi:hypothetical protein